MGLVSEACLGNDLGATWGHGVGVGLAMAGVELVVALGTALGGALGVALGPDLGLALLDRLGVALHAAVGGGSKSRQSWAACLWRMPQRAASSSALKFTGWPGHTVTVNPSNRQGSQVTV